MDPSWVISYLTPLVIHCFWGGKPGKIDRSNAVPWIWFRRTARRGEVSAICLTGTDVWKNIAKIWETSLKSHDEKGKTQKTCGVAIIPSLFCHWLGFVYRFYSDLLWILKNYIRWTCCKCFVSGGWQSCSIQTRRMYFGFLFLFSYLRFSHPGSSYLRDVFLLHLNNWHCWEHTPAVSGYATNRAVQAEKGHLPSTRSQKKACRLTVFFPLGCLLIKISGFVG